MDAALELKLTEQKIQTTTTKLQQLEQDKQGLLQELLRLDGEHRLLLRMQRETAQKEPTK